MKRRSLKHAAPGNLPTPGRLPPTARRNHASSSSSSAREHLFQDATHHIVVIADRNSRRASAFEVPDPRIDWLVAGE